MQSYLIFAILACFVLHATMQQVSTWGQEKCFTLNGIQRCYQLYNGKIERSPEGKIIPEGNYIRIDSNDQLI